MSILDKASLIQIPSGYKNGKLYSVKPTPSYGSEQISNGDFSDGSTGWTVTNGTVTDKYNASMTAYQNGIKVTPFSLSGTYKLVFDLTITSGSCKFDGGGSNSQTYTTSGRKELTITNPTKFEFNAFNLGWVGTLDNVSVKEVLVADGDFTFSRSSSATRVNSEGLIEVASVVSTTELVTNGDFATDSDWVKAPSGVTISGGSANFNASVDSYVYQDIITVGKTYKVTFSGVITSGAFYIGENGQAVNVFTSGTYVNQEATFTVLASTRFIIRASSVPFVGSIDNVSVKEVIENDVPRLDYSDGSCASLLLEPQRTNLLPYSDFSSGFTTTNVTLSNNQGTSPDGTSNATKALMASGTGSHRVYDAISSSLNDDNVISVFIKEQNDISHIGLAADTMSNQVWFSGSDGSIINANGLDAKTESFGNGWHRISVHYVADSNDTGDNQFIYFSNRENNSPNVAFDGTEEILLYGIQAEKGKYLTSLINTEGSTVTRTADVCNNAGTSATFNSTEGVLFAEIAALANDGTYRMISLSDGTATNRISFFYQNSPSNTIAVESAGSGTNLGIYGQSLTITNSNKIAVKYKANDCALWVNGVEIATDTSFAAFSSGTFTKLSFDRGDGINDFYGKTKQLMTFNEALSDEELSDLTGQVNLSFNNLATFYGYTIL